MNNKLLLIIMIAIINRINLGAQGEDFEQKYLIAHQQTYKQTLAQLQDPEYTNTVKQDLKDPKWRKKIDFHQQNSLINLKRSFIVSHKEWNNLRSFITEIKEMNEQYKYVALKDCNHSLSESDTLQSIKEIIKSYGFNPYRISIIDLQDSNIQTTNNVFYTQPPLPQLNKKDNNLKIVENTFSPGILALNLKKINSLEDTNAKAAITLQAIQQIIYPDAIVPHILKEYFKIKYASESPAILQSPEFQTVENLHSFSFPIVTEALNNRDFALKMYHYFLKYPNSKFRSWQILCYIQLIWAKIAMLPIE